MASSDSAPIGFVTPRPFIKWVGGKRQLLAELVQHAPPKFNRYFEPFVGGGALFFRLEHKKPAVLADWNQRLVRTYQGIRDSVEDVIQLLNDDYKHDPDFFAKERTRPIDDGTDADVAAWFIYLNRTGYNGLYRVNSRNVFNVPFGDYAKPRFCQPALLRSCAEKLKRTTLLHADFEDVASKARKGDFVYFDPPYVPVSATSNFTSYTSKGFDSDAQVRLRDTALKLKRRGVHVLLSNSSAKQVYELYQEHFKIVEVHATRQLNSKVEGRGKVIEVLIK
jgi:DNA adenine methylase